MLKNKLNNKNKISKLLKNFKEDKKSESLNEHNEEVLTKTIKKIINKNKLKPINTKCLLN